MSCLRWLTSAFIVLSFQAGTEWALAATTPAQEGRTSAIGLQFPTPVKGISQPAAEPLQYQAEGNYAVMQQRLTPGIWGNQAGTFIYSLDGATRYLELRFVR